MKILYKTIIFLGLLYTPFWGLAQNRTISGLVQDKEGPMPGVNILEKGAPNNGVSTSLDGLFQITLRGNSNTLIISAVGYLTKQVSVRNGQNITITMDVDAKSLEEVVVVGYGTQKKIAVTGAVSSVTREDIRQTPSASLQNSLTGKLPGFSSQQKGGRPGADAADFYIRGVSTFNGTGAAIQPLILVDDVPYTYADFQNIDPNEVESVSILKDAATTAPYGVKGANGVVLVTTRRGKVGKAQITARTEAGVQLPTYVPQMLDAANTAILYNEAQRNDYIISKGNATGYVPKYSENDIALFANGTDPYLHPNIDWWNTLFKKYTSMNKTNVDLSGGTTNFKYFISGGYENQGGLLRQFHSDDVNNGYFFDRYNFRSNLDITASKSLTFKVNFSGNNTVTNNPRVNSRSNNETAVIYEIYNYTFLNPYVYPIFNPNGTYGMSDPNSPTSFNNIVGRLTQNGYTRVRQNLLSLTFSADQKLDVITKGLQAKVQVAITNGNSSTRGLNRVTFPSFYFDGVNYIPFKAAESRYAPYSLDYSAGNPRRQSTVQANLNYAHAFGKHNVSALVLYNQNTQLNYSATGGAEDVNSYKPQNFKGLTSRATYNYDNRYILEFNGSYNGSDKFSESHRYGFFPAASAAYVISEENFMKNNLPVFDLLKFRGSYGIVGSDNLGSFLSFYEENFARGAGYSFGETSASYTSIVPGTLGNDQVSWEKERKINLGMDFSVLKGRLSGSIDVFDNKRSDILAQRNTIASYFGVPDGQLPPENLGIVSNKGLEVELTYAGKIGKDLGFRLKATYGYAKNKILFMDEVPTLYPYQANTGRSIGEVSIFVFDGYYTPQEAADPTVPKYSGSSVGGVANTTLPGFLKYRDMNGDGLITNDDLAFVGRPNIPTTTIGFSPGFTFKRFSLNFMLQSAYGNDVRVGYIYSSPFTGNLQQVHLGRWTPETAATATFPTINYNFAGTYMSNNHSQYWSVPGTYLRIKSIEFGYSLPEKWINKIGLSGARLYLNGYNLYTWSAVKNRTGLDPEVASQELSGDYVGVYPNMANINLGLNITLK